MPTTRAPYSGGRSDKTIEDFSDDLKNKIRDYYPENDVEPDQRWGHPADVFVQAVLAEARFAIDELHWQKFDITKQELRAEQSDLLKVLTDANWKLRSLSPDFNRLLGVYADPLGCADRIIEMIRHVEGVLPLIKEMSIKPKPVDKQHHVAVEMAIRVLSVLKNYGIAPAATGDNYFGYTSDAVEILQAIGNDIGLSREALTWRDIIIEAKEATPDL